MHEYPIWEVGPFNIDLSTFLGIIVSFVVVFVLARLAVRNLSVDNPSRMQNFMEWVIEFVQNLVASTMDLKKGRPYIALGITLIMFILVSNLLGLPFAIVTGHQEEVTLLGYPVVSEATISAAHGEHGAEVVWWKSPTADLSVTFGLAIMVFVLTNFLGLTRNTKHYLKHFVEPYPIFLPLNIIEQLAKPLTLGLRLFANIFAGEVLIATIVMAGWFGIPLLAAWQGFSIFVGAIQAFLFTILTMVYIAQASVHEEH
ncbi:ATP synthase subunit a [Paenibacillus sp. J31TS4]|uniref:F0F1 ATP synthase subunit A n=1 Tax=Paenibacillus sp. J31TS4 TaxID=2807195 RepID=UPI001B0DC917|nr:F0F1 ATP synthase subunit A [Paenibacillus sp. J31TS4]GIP40936.1 ATP synthase subunit a [Paenibacillus sp. J31TS4]